MFINVIKIDNQITLPPQIFYVSLFSVTKNRGQITVALIIPEILSMPL